MELNRKFVTVILILLIIMVPLVALSWNIIAPTSLDDIFITSVVPDEFERDGVFIIGGTEGGGKAFDGQVNLLITHEEEQVYSGRVSFEDGILNHKLMLNEFAVGNGDYQFKIVHEGYDDTYDFDLAMVVEELNVVTSVTYDVENPPPGTQPWEALYSYFISFNTGWNYYSHTVEPNEFYSYSPGYIFEGNFTPLKAIADPENGMKVEFIFTDAQGNQRIEDTYTLQAGDSLDRDLSLNKNGTFIYKFINDNTASITIDVFENLEVELPKDQRVDFLFQLGTQTQDDFQMISKPSSVDGYIKPTLGPGNYQVSIAFDNSLAKPTSPFASLLFTETLLLNDIPRGDVSAGEPYILDRLGGRAVTFDATASFDDGPKTDLTVSWYFGTTSDGYPIGETGSVEGPWDDYKTYTFTYPVGEVPDLVNGKPYLILIDAFGTETKPVYINLQIQ